MEPFPFDRKPVTGPWHDTIPRADAGTGRSRYEPQILRVTPSHQRRYGDRSAPHVSIASVPPRRRVDPELIDRAAAVLPPGPARVLALGAIAPGALAERRPRWTIDTAPPGSSDTGYDLIVADALFHRVAVPGPMLDAVASLLAGHGRFLARDLRRPSRLTRRLHLAWYGRHLDRGSASELAVSIGSALTTSEMELILRRSRLREASITEHGPYLYVER